MELVAVRGARINSMKTMIKKKEINLSLYSHIIIHLGTNDVNSTTDKIIADLESSFFLLKVLIVWLNFLFHLYCPDQLILITQILNVKVLISYYVKYVLCIMYILFDHIKDFF